MRVTVVAHLVPSFGQATHHATRGRIIQIRADHEERGTHGMAFQDLEKARQAAAEDHVCQVRGRSAEPVDSVIAGDRIQIDADAGEKTPPHQPLTRMAQVSFAMFLSTFGTRRNKLIEGFRFSATRSGISTTFLRSRPARTTSSDANRSLSTMQWVTVSVSAFRRKALS